MDRDPPPFRPRLLILDDDAEICRMIQLIAEPYGYETRVALEPAHFFRALAEWSPTHIALDLVMPRMDGVEVLAELARRDCRARIVITSGVGGRVLGAAARSGGEHGLNIAGILPKPFTPTDLRSALRAPLPGTAPAPSGVRDGGPSFEVSESGLRHAIGHGELTVVYQPKVRCDDGTLSGFEALVRWMHPEWGVIMPDRFIPFAETHDLIDAITDCVLQTSLGWLVRAFPDGAPAPSLAVNISARSLGDSALVERVSARCLEHGVEPGRLIFELTETSAMADPVASLDLLTRLRMKGFRLSIDDFGTGYSSMMQLARLPFSEIKVDKSFVMTLPASDESRAVVRSIIELGHSLGMVATAEGVESEATLDFLNSAGCDLAQGYHIARPMTERGVERWLQQRYSSRG
jgi:EAL domain-containing protein (putative c-di-GMP-specific phosphodiesterase class I)/ActR/RegA family two-component response regulator